MRNKIFIILFYFGLIVKINCQYSITAITPPPQFTHEDLWNLSLTRGNLSDGVSQFMVGLRIYNSSYQLEVKTNTMQFNFPTNSLVINLSNLSTYKPFSIQYYNGTTLQHVVNTGGLFPAGLYNIEFVLMGRPSDGEFTELANFNYQTTIEALWPPLLVIPFDEDTVNTTNPTLVWTPAFSSNYMGSIVYTLKIAEIKLGQTKEQAIASNLVSYRRDNLEGTFHSVTVPLSFNKDYAWKVEANLGGSVLSSQLWKFSLIDASYPPKNYDNGYAELNFSKPGSFIYKAENFKLNVRYEEEYNLPSNYQNLSFKIFDYKGNVIVQNVCTGVSPCNIVKGVNYITFNLNSYGLIKGNYYLLEISNLKNEKWYLRFVPLKFELIGIPADPYE